jgi:Na+(H+)/acetate symporter ActP
VAAIVAVIVATLVIGSRGIRSTKTTSDFLVASRSVRPFFNASAISGEYLSAASFLGVAGLIMRYGFDMLWYPVGYTAGYLLLLLLIASPLRRSGAYTIPDFAEGRLSSRRLRKVAAGFVVLIGVFYLLPQLKGAGITIQSALGVPYWVGVVAVGAVIVATISVRGMRSVTLAQAFLYWVKVVVLALPVVFLTIHLTSGDLRELHSASRPTFARATTVHFPQRTSFGVATAEDVVAHGEVDGRLVDGRLLLLPGEHSASTHAALRFPAGSRVPLANGQPGVSGSAWSAPFGSNGQGNGHPLFFVYSILIALFLGTMGLPHILVRFYTNRDGRDARRTTLVVLALIGVFYFFPTALGALGRLWAPQLYLTGQTDAVVLTLPEAALHSWAGQMLTALVSAGAIAAFLSTSSGLLVSVAGALSHDVFGSTVRSFRRSTVAAGAVAILLGVQVSGFDINVLVSWAFVIAASSFCPLLVLGIWWPRLTAPGAIAGIVVGGGVSSASIAATMLGLHPGGWWAVLLAEPAAWTVPLSFATMTFVSLRTSGRVPDLVTARMAAMHLPEALSLSSATR